MTAPLEGLPPAQIPSVIDGVAPYRIDAEDVLRVVGGEWQRSHPTDSAILRELDRIREANDQAHLPAPSGEVERKKDNQI